MARAKVPKPVTVDFESFGIEGRPVYPPVPVGVSIKPFGKPAKYYAWGHLTGNNCTWGTAFRALQAIWNHPDGLLFQNGKFDVDVADVHMGLPIPAWDKIHDTMFLLFLDDPHQRELGLKPSAERLLHLPPEEQDAVGNWLVLNQPVPGIKISLAKKSEHYFGRYIAFAPGDLVGKYANGDTERTEKLFQLLYQKTIDRGMVPAYDRERQLMPILLEMERQGVPVDLPRLRSDVAMYTEVQGQLDQWLYKRLKTDQINLNSGDKLVEALVGLGLADPDKLGVTDGGKYRSDKEAMAAAVTDPVLLAMLKYRTQLGTCLKTFMTSWLRTAEASGGYIYTSWNQVKGDVGTRTGRLSSTPNFQNIPKEFDLAFKHEVEAAIKAETDPDELKKLKALLKAVPKCPLKVMTPPLPMVRSYIIPWSSDHLLGDRDYSQQELRILAHFEGGRLKDAYEEDMWLDVHDYVRKMVNEMLKRNYARKPIKNTVFGLIYGMGVGKLAIKSNITVEEANEVKNAILDVFPGLKALYKDMKVLAKSKTPIHTWGSREYYCEEPKIIQGRMRTFDYKMLNVLVQGSAADCTKAAMIAYWPTKGPNTKVLLTVHDEVLFSCPKKEFTVEMAKLTKAMEGVAFDVPMLSEGKSTSTNWAELKPYDKKGKVL